MKFSSSPAWLQRRAICIVLIATSALASCAPPAPVGSGPWLLDSLQRLADDGLLFEPDRVARVLDLQIAPATPKELNDQPPACKKPDTGRSLISIKYFPITPWLETFQQNVEPVTKPESTLIPGTGSGNPKLTYSELTWRPCSDRYPEEREATLTIDSLSAVACYRQRDLEQRFRQQAELATDMGTVVSYTANNHSDKSSLLSFWFSYREPCAVSANLRQGVRYSRRWTRAYSKRQQCIMDKGLDACGNVSDFYIREPD